MRINQLIKFVLLLLVSLPVVGRAEVKLNSLGVTPIQPLYETVGDTALLNCEMTFENTGFPLELVSWKVRANYFNHASVDTPGLAEDFWYNVRIRSLNSWPLETTKVEAGYFENGVYNQGYWQIGTDARVVFYLPYTDYPLADLPSSLNVFVRFRDKILHEERELQFRIRPPSQIGRAHV